MKKLFQGYYQLTDAQIANIWTNGFISLDTNVLFNIYKYSDETRKELLRIIKKFSSKLWLTNHAAYEFHKNRITVISDQIVIYENTIRDLNKLANEIIKNAKSPHLGKSILNNFDKTIKSTIKDLERKKTFYKNLLQKDPILKTISSIFNNKVGEAFSSEQLENLKKEGEERYKKKIPPGFKDNDKPENKFGDLIIWKELVEKSRTDKKPFLLIIDDLKEDWWLRSQGLTISPRQELSQELYLEANQAFHMYTPDRFLEYASKTDDVKQETIDEIRDIRSEKSSHDFGVFDLAGQISSGAAGYKFLSNRNGNFDQINSLASNAKFMENLNHLQQLSPLNSTWALPNGMNEILEANQTYAGLQKIQQIAELQNQLKKLEVESGIVGLKKTPILKSDSDSLDNPDFKAE